MPEETWRERSACASEGTTWASLERCLGPISCYLFEPVEATTADLFAAYGTNELAARDKYENKRLGVSGTVEKVTASGSDAWLILSHREGRKFSLNQVHYKMAKSQQHLALDVKPGDPVRVEGRITNVGLDGEIQMDACPMP